MSKSTSTVYFVRHGDAGRSHPEDRSDIYRPLTQKGERQARELARALLFGNVVAALASSAAPRCKETVRPLAELVGKEIEEVDELMTGSDGADALSWAIRKRAELANSEALVLCSHGDVLSGVLEIVSEGGITEVDTFVVRKGGYIELTMDDGSIASVRVRPPPK